MLTLFVSNSQGRNLGCSVTSARTSGLSSIQGDLGESGKGILSYLQVNSKLLFTSQDTIALMLVLKSRNGTETIKNSLIYTGMSHNCKEITRDCVV